MNPLTRTIVISTLLSTWLWSLPLLAAETKADATQRVIPLVEILVSLSSILNFQLLKESDDSIFHFIA